MGSGTHKSPSAAVALPRAARVVIVGGGVIGLAVAYALARRGEGDVVVCERGPLAGEASGANAGGLWAQDFLIESGWGDDHMNHFTVEGVHLFRELARRPELNLTHRENGYLFVFRCESELEESAALMPLVRERGVRAELLDAAALRLREPALTHELTGGLFMADDAHVDPFSVTRGFAREARRRGVRLASYTRVTGLEVTGGRVSAALTDRGRIACRWLVNAAGPWAGEVGDMAGVPVPVGPVRGQMIVTEKLPRLLGASVEDQTSVGQTAEGSILAGGTKEPGVGDTKAHRHNVEFLARQVHWLIPAARSARVVRTWTRVRPIAADGLPIIGRSTRVENFLTATGHYSRGLMLSAITGESIAGLILEGACPYDLKAASPTRFEGEQGRRGPRAEANR